MSYARSAHCLTQTARTNHGAWCLLAFSPIDRTMDVVHRRAIVSRSIRGVQECEAFLYDFWCALTSPMHIDAHVPPETLTLLRLDAPRRVASVCMPVRQRIRGVGSPSD